MKKLLSGFMALALVLSDGASSWAEPAPSADRSLANASSSAGRTPAEASSAVVRPPAVAGRFYPADPAKLGAFVGKALVEAGREEAAGELVALLVPHAGLEYSGRTAAKAYRLLSPGDWDSVVVVGTGHYKELDGAAIYPGAYATPEGSFPFDAALAEELRRASPLIVFDAKAHQKEHSIEVQLPFLRRGAGKAKLVALVMNTQDLEAARAVGLALAKALRGKRALLIASSDLSHYPTGVVADAVDKTTLKALEGLDPAYFWITNRFFLNRGLPHLAVTYCGEGAVTAVMTAARALGATGVKVLGRINSGDVVSERDYNHVVGYAAAAFFKAPGRSAEPNWLLAALSASEKKDLLGLARRALTGFLSTGKLSPAALSPSPLLNLPAATFVTIWGKGGELRGCVGETSPRASLAESVAHNAVASATADPRFKSVGAAELAEARLEISLLSPLRLVKGFAEIKSGDGVTIEREGRSGVFLPKVWEKLKDRTAFLEELCSQKAGLPKDCYKDRETRLKIFSAEEFSEPG